MSSDPQGTTQSVPHISFVIPAVNTFGDLQKTIRAIESEQSSATIEVLVVSRLGADFAARARSEFPWISVVEVERDTPIPQMRGIAFERVTAPVVAVIEDHVQIPTGWVNTALRSQVTAGDVVAGPVANLATHTLVDRAAFICEYSHCLPPVPSAQSDWLPGNSVAYPAPLLRAHAHTVAAGGWENELHASMQAAGAKLFFVSELQVGHDKHYSVWEYFSQRYLYARSYAGNRVRAKGLGPRLAYAAATAALPALLLLRIWQRVSRRPDYRATTLTALPLLLLFVTSWGAGEFVGYLFGAGQSLGKVR